MSKKGNKSRGRGVSNKRNVVIGDRNYLLKVVLLFCCNFVVLNQEVVVILITHNCNAFCYQGGIIPSEW